MRSKVSDKFSVTSSVYFGYNGAWIYRCCSKRCKTYKSLLLYCDFLEKLFTRGILKKFLETSICNSTPFCSGNVYKNFWIIYHPIKTPISICRRLNKYAYQGSCQALRFQRNDLPIEIQKETQSKSKFKIVLKKRNRRCHATEKEAFVWKSEPRAFTIHNNIEGKITECWLVNERVFFFSNFALLIQSRSCFCFSVTRASRFAIIDEEYIEELRDKSEHENEKNSTEWWGNIFKKWAYARNVRANLEEYKIDVLDQRLWQF